MSRTSVAWEKITVVAVRIEKMHGECIEETYIIRTPPACASPSPENVRRRSATLAQRIRIPKPQPKPRKRGPTPIPIPTQGHPTYGPDP